MNEQRQQRRDDFAFSLRGFSVIASFAAPIAISDERFRRASDARPASRPEAPVRPEWMPADQPGCC